MQRLPYVILVAPAPAASYLDEHPNDTADSFPPRSTDSQMALRFDSFAEARSTLRLAVRKWPLHSFRIDVLAD